MAPAAQGSGGRDRRQTPRDLGAGVSQRAGRAARRHAGEIAGLLRYTQTLTLWRRCRPRRLPHHHRRIHRRRPAAAAALALPGARRDAGQRGRRRGDRPRFRSDAPTGFHGSRWTPRCFRTPWTTPPTAGSGCRRRCGCGSAAASVARAISVAEVVAPARTDAASDAAGARPDGRAGRAPASPPRAPAPTSRATATSPSTRTCPMCGSALGGPDENAFTAAVLGGGRPRHTAEWIRGSSRPLRARFGCPLGADGCDGCPVPTCGCRALPVCRCRQRRRRTRAVAALIDDLADAEIVVDQDAPARSSDFESRTVARAQPRRARASPSTPTARCTPR